MTIPGKDLHEYAAAWSIEHDKKFSFEAVHSRIRKEQALRLILGSPHAIILEIGCGLDPLFPYIPDFDRYFIVEPIEKFAAMAVDKSAGSSKVTVINNYFERCFDKFRDIHLDHIILNGVLHEVPDPRLLLESIHTVCRESTQVYLSIPNRNSLHRLLAYEMGIISSPYELSDTNKKFKTTSVFDKNRLKDLVESTGFSVQDMGTYFVKPFSNQQMEAIIDQGIVDIRIIHGLEGLIQYMPDLGSELYAILKPGVS
jgi:2-polyprenyl-3-methyl-5-hydroxy-6-metoxy-1,4-benzoquinol methylase